MNADHEAMQSVARELKDGAVELEVLLVTVKNITLRTITSMVQRGYIERTRYPNRRLLSGERLREEYVALTEKGRRAFGFPL